MKSIVSHAVRRSPLEACGFIVRDGDFWSIHPVPNAARDPEREFVMEPQSQIDALGRVRGSGSDLFGTYHSHPKTPPVPSEKDLQLALYPDLLHLIVSLAEGEPEFGLWRITNRKGWTCAGFGA